MMRLFFMLVAIAALIMPTRASAEVISASPSAFLLQAETVTAASPEHAWRALSQIGRWWSPAHTYSGDARRMRLDARAGGCFCETWGQGQSVEHGRVVLVMEHEGARTLRVQGALGPLQEMGVNGVLSFVVAPHEGGVKITMSYRVSGDAGLALLNLAPPVDHVFTEQFTRLIRYVDSGNAEERQDG